MSAEVLQEEFFYLLGYLLTSARGLYDEPAEYGIFRMLDTTDRILAILQAQGLTDDYMDRVKSALSTEKSSGMDDDRQKAVLDQLVADYTVELQRRIAS